jgi:hypothetical protein
VLRLSYAISAILPQNARSRRVAERSGARIAGQMEVLGLTWDRYHWPLATGGEPWLQPEGVTLMTATPAPSEVIELDVDDPGTVRKPP